MKNKLRVFDFDDTLVKTNSMVMVRNKEGVMTQELTPSEFAVHQAPNGYTYDFSQFDEVKDAETKRHSVVLAKMLEADDSQIVILTARAQNARRAIQGYLVSTFGTKAETIEVITLGSSDPYDKALWIREKCLNDGYYDVYFVDDSWKNCRAVGDVLDSVQEITKLKIQKL